MSKPRKDITGRRFGRWTIVRFIKDTKWIARCDCGTERVVRREHLVRGGSQSCGCRVSSRPKVLGDISGQTYGRWTVLGYMGMKKWLCRCVCGTERGVRKGPLTSGTSKSCGCAGNTSPRRLRNTDIGGKRPYRRKDLRGRVFGRLTVIVCAGVDRWGSTMWLCQCTCGDVARTISHKLTSGHTQSCGCLRRDRVTGKNSSTYIHGLSSTAGVRRLYTLNRLAKKHKQTPPWADLDHIREIYAGCPEGYHVDHIYPLRGKLVSGLHVPENLQYLTAQENLRKHCAFDPVISFGSLQLV